MDYPFIERRRAPRASTETAALSAVHVSVPVRLLDLGSQGLLMASWAPLRVGSTVRVAAAFAGRRLESTPPSRFRPVAAAARWRSGGSFASFGAARQSSPRFWPHAAGFDEPTPLAAQGRGPPVDPPRRNVLPAAGMTSPAGPGVVEFPAA